MSTSVQPPVPYVFDNDDPDAVDRHECLASVLDGPTFELLAGLGDLTGKRCLEIGAGGGSVARWLADRTGPDGQVVATDVNIRHVPRDQGFRVLRHNVVTDPVPDGGWDVIHARLVLMHVPERRAVLPKLAAALAPGGALVVEEWDTSVTEIVLAAPDDESRELVNRYQRTLIERIMLANGNDPAWARKVHGAMLDSGLSNVDTRVHARSWRGGSAGAMLHAVNIAQTRDKLLDNGFTTAQLARISAMVTADPRLVVRGHLTYSTVGRKS